jgi:hypothetical protein
MFFSEPVQNTVSVTRNAFCVGVFCKSEHHVVRNLEGLPKIGRPSENRKAFRKSERVLKIGRRVLSDVAVSPNRTCSYSDVAFRFRWP